MRVLSLPKNDNPYQELLYAPMRRQGIPVSYGGDLTKSHTLNQLLLPLELLCRRARGFDVVHIHWLFGFRFYGAHRHRELLRVSRLWFGVILRLTRMLGYRVVWTTHNVLPHSPIFDDDIAARRRLVSACDLVIVHAANAVDGLRAIGATPTRVCTIPPGVYDDPQFATLPPPPPRPPTHLLCFGQVAAYKGVEDLLEVVGTLAAPITVTVAGRCPDPGLRARLERLAAARPDAINLQLHHVDEEKIAPLFSAAHAAVLPFRRVTTSSSVILALASGRPVLVPGLAAFDGIPPEAIVRYEPGVAGLRDGLEKLASASAEALRQTGERGRRFALRRSWDETASETIAALGELDSVSPHVQVEARDVWRRRSRS
jgi:glycosyltransferase involved in cell wall biosynthesis